MQLIEPASEGVMIALFLKTELDSGRFQEQLIALLNRTGVERRLIDWPNLASPEENAIRASLLAEWRGYRRGTDVFTYYPESPEWWRCRIPTEEIPNIRYIDDDYWVELSGGTRRLGDAARRIRDGVLVYGQRTDWAFGLARSIAAGARPPEAILVAPDKSSPLTILEGHSRLTAYCLALDHLPAGIIALVGFGAEFAHV